MPNPDDIGQEYQQTIDESNRRVFNIDPVQIGHDVYMGVQAGGEQTKGEKVPLEPPMAGTDGNQPADAMPVAQDEQTPPSNATPRREFTVDTPEVAAVKQQFAAEMQKMASGEAGVEALGRGGKALAEAARPGFVTAARALGMDETAAEAVGDGFVQFMGGLPGNDATDFQAGIETALAALPVLGVAMKGGKAAKEFLATNKDQIISEFQKAVSLVKNERGSVPLGGGAGKPPEVPPVNIVPAGAEPEDGMSGAIASLPAIIQRTQRMRDPEVERLFEEARSQAEGFAEAVHVQRRGVLHDEDVIKLSKKSDLTLESIIGLPPGTTLAAEHLQKVRDTLKLSFQAMKRSSKQAMVNGTVDDYKEFFQSVGETRDVLRVMLGLYAEPARDVRIMHQALPKAADGMDDTAKALEAVAAETAGKEFRIADPWVNQLYEFFAEMEKAANATKPTGAGGKATGQAAQLTHAVAPGSPFRQLAESVNELKGEEEMAAFIRSLDSPKFWDVWLENWYNSMLLGLAPVKNLIGSPAILAAEIANRGVAAGIDSIGTGMVRWIARTDMQREMYMGEVGAMLHGVLESLADAAKASWTAFKNNKPVIPGESLAPGELPYRASATSQALQLTGVMGRAVDFMTTMGPRLLQGGDAFNKVVARRAELRALALRKAYQSVYSEGLSGAEAARRVQEIKASVLANPQAFPEINAQADLFAQYVTLQEELGTAGQKFSDFVVHWNLGDPQRGGISGFPIGRWLFPFNKIVMNSSKMAGEWSGPLSLLSQSIRDEIAAGGARRDAQLGKIALSTMYVALLAEAAMNGLITGTGPRDSQAKQQWKDEQGKKIPNAYWDPISKEYRSTQGLEPFNTIAGAVADMVDIISHAPTSQDWVQRTQLGIEALVLSVTNNIGAKSYLRGMTGFIDGMFTGSMDDLEGYLKKQGPGMMIPYAGALRQIKQGVDPVARQAIDFKDMMLRDIPGWSKDVPAERNGLGKPIIRDGGWWNPMYHGVLSEDAELWSVLNKHGIVLGKVESTVDGVKLNGKQYDKYQELATEGLADDLTEKLVGHDDDMTDQEVERIVRQAQGWRRQNAIQAMRDGDYFPALADKLEGQQEKKREGKSLKPSPFSAGKIGREHFQAPNLQ